MPGFAAICAEGARARGAGRAHESQCQSFAHPVRSGPGRVARPSAHTGGGERAPTSSAEADGKHLQTRAAGPGRTDGLRGLGCNIFEREAAVALQQKLTHL